MNLENSGLLAAGELHGLFPVPTEHTSSSVEAEQGYFPSPAAVLGWSAVIDPFPLSTIAFRVPFLTVRDYVRWMNATVPQFRDIFDRLGVTTSLEIYAHGHVPRDYRNVIPLLSLWNRDSHTFISRFHEFTVTLLDVHLLTRLPLSGEAPLMVTEAGLSREEIRIIGLLRFGAQRIRHDGPYSPGAWVSFFCNRYFDDPRVHIAAFLSVWLDQFVFPSSCKARSDGVSSRVFSIAARLACGTRLALAPAFLGTLYWRLDQFSIDLSRSFGRFEVISMVDICLLQTLLWEYFPSVAPTHRGSPNIVLRDGDLRSSSRIQPRVFWWSRRSLPSHMIPIEVGLNSINSFFPTPYQVERPNMFSEPVYKRIHRSFVFRPKAEKEILSVWAPQVVLTLLGGHLPAFKEHLNQSSYWDKEVYNPQRVLSQFGLVQGVPAAAPAMSFKEIEYRFLTAHIRKHNYLATFLRICPTPGFKVTANYIKYWSTLQRSLFIFRTQPRARLAPTLVNYSDPTLQGNPP